MIWKDQPILHDGEGATGDKIDGRFRNLLPWQRACDADHALANLQAVRYTRHLQQHTTQMDQASMTSFLLRCLSRFVGNKNSPHVEVAGGVTLYQRLLLERVQQQSGKRWQPRWFGWLLTWAGAGL